MLTTPSRMTTMLSVEAGNAAIYFAETNGVTPVQILAVVSLDDYQPHDLLDLLMVEMSAASATYGYGSFYSWGISHPSGQISISVSGGGATGWYPKITASESTKLLTGGDVAVGLVGQYHLGWVVDSSYPAFATTHTGSLPVWGSWEPAYPPQSLDTDTFAINSQSFDQGGDHTTFDFSPDETREIYKKGWTFIDQDDYDQLFEFWRAARSGRQIAFFEDRTVIAPEYLILTSIGELAWSRLSGLPRYEGTLEFAPWS